MKVYFYALMAMSLIITQINADEPAEDSVENAEEIVVTSSILNTSRILNPLYVIDGDDLADDATTSLGEAVDSYLGVSIADYGAAVGQPIIRGMSGPRVKILKNGMVNRDVRSRGRSFERCRFTRCCSSRNNKRTFFFVICEWNDWWDYKCC